MLSDNEFDDFLLRIQLLGTLVLCRVRETIADGAKLPPRLISSVYDGVVSDPKDLDTHGLNILPVVQAR